MGLWNEIKLFVLTKIMFQKLQDTFIEANTNNTEKLKEGENVSKK